MKWPIKKKEHMMGKKRKRGTANKKQQPYFLKRKEEVAGNVSEERVKGWIHVIRVSTRYNPIEPTATRQGKRRSRTKTEWAVSWNIETTTPHLYIVNERYNSRNQRASKEEKTNKQIMNVEKKRQLAQPQILTQGGPRNRLSIELERTNLVHRYEWWNKQG